MECNKVQEAFFLLLGQDHKTVAGGGQHRHARYFRGKGRGYAVYYEDDEYDPDHEWQNDPNLDYEKGYYKDETCSQDPSPTAADSYVDESYEDFDNDAAYHQTLADVDSAEQAEEFDSAYATYIDARRYLNEIKLSRGYLPMVTLTEIHHRRPLLRQAHQDVARGRQRRARERGYQSNILPAARLKSLIQKGDQKPVAVRSLVCVMGKLVT